MITAEFLYTLNFFLNIYFIFIGKSHIKRGGETETKIFRLIIHSPNSCISWSLADLKPGPWSLLQVSHTGSESQGFGPSLTAFPGHRQRAGWEVELPGLEQMPILDPSRFKVRTSATRLLCWALLKERFIDSLERQSD